MRRFAFTLVELLIVVLIVSCLFLFSGRGIGFGDDTITRSKVSRARTDLRTASGRLEAAFANSKRLPPRLGDGFLDPFRSGKPLLYATNGAAALIWSVGPDGTSDVDPAAVSRHAADETLRAEFDRTGTTYDPTNGVRSRGDVWRAVFASR